MLHVALQRTQHQHNRAVLHVEQMQHAPVVIHVHIIQTHVVAHKPVPAISLGVPGAQP